MYPFVRLAYQMWRHRNDPPPAIDEPHISHHICWPWDLDFQMELNNGRTLTLYDLGRIPYANRVGLMRVLKEQGWMLAMAGASVRWRRRVRMFHKIEMRTAYIGRDERFFYLLQTMWRNGEAVSSLLCRTVVSDKNGIVSTDRLAEHLPEYIADREMPQWVQDWIAAENARTWPPEV